MVLKKKNISSKLQFNEGIKPSSCQGSEVRVNRLVGDNQGAIEVHGTRRVYLIIKLGGVSDYVSVVSGLKQKLLLIIDDMFDLIPQPTIHLNIYIFLSKTPHVNFGNFGDRSLCGRESHAAVSYSLHMPNHVNTQTGR